MGKYFNVDVIPDCIAEDVSENNGSTDVGGGDIIFGWTAVDVPKGSCMIKSITAYANGEDGAYGAGSLTDLELIFAKSIDGVAPASLGAINAAPTGFIRSNVVGAARLESEASKGTLSKTAFGVVYSHGISGGANTNIGPNVVIDLEPDSGTNVGYDKLYVAGLQVSARNYGTAVLANGAVDASTAQATEVVVDGVDARKIFSVGDTVYVFDLDTPIPGTLTKVEALKLTFSEANTTVDIANNDELLNANPWRLKIGFEK